MIALQQFGIHFFFDGNAQSFEDFAKSGVELVQLLQDFILTLLKFLEQLARLMTGNERGGNG